MVSGGPGTEPCGDDGGVALQSVLRISPVGLPQRGNDRDRGGMWAATASWRVRSGLAHTISLILVLFGFVLAGSELLTRNGYAVDRATWQCEDPLLDTTVSA